MGMCGKKKAFVQKKTCASAQAGVIKNFDVHPSIPLGQLIYQVSASSHHPINATILRKM